MQECLKRFAKRKPQPKWTQEEKEQLRSAVLEINPIENEGWREVCLRMHQLGSRKTQHEYKTKGIIFLQNHQRQQIKLNNEDLDLISDQFQTGSSIPFLTKKFAHLFINPVRLRSRLIQRFQSIRCSIRRVVGLSKTRPIKIQDYELFAFIRSNGGDLLSIAKVAQLSRRHKVIKKPKTAEQKMQLQEIEKQLAQYNQSLIYFSDTFNQFKNNPPKNSSGEHRGKIEMNRSPTVPFHHLAEITKIFSETKFEAASLSECSFLKEAEEQKLRQADICNIDTIHSLIQDELPSRKFSDYFRFGQCSIDQQSCDFQMSSYCRQDQLPTEI